MDEEGEFKQDLGSKYQSESGTASQMQSLQRKWLVELVAWLLDPFSKIKAIQRNQSTKRGEGVIQRFFWRKWLYCYFLICLKSSLSLIGENMIRITSRHRRVRAGLVLVKSHPRRLPGRARGLQQHGQGQGGYCQMFKNQLSGNKPISYDFYFYFYFFAYQFYECKYSHHGQCSATSLNSLNTQSEMQVHNQLLWSGVGQLINGWTTSEPGAPHSTRLACERSQWWVCL